jgi:hypothetical protein
MAVVGADALMSMEDPTEGTFDELCWRWRDAQVWRKQLDDVIAALETDMVSRMEEDHQPVRGLGLMRRYKAKQTAWRDGSASADFRRDVGDVVVNHVAMDIATGELDPVKRNIARATVATLYEVIPAFSSVKARGQAMGIDLDQYRATTETYKIALDPEFVEDK